MSATITNDMRKAAIKDASPRIGKYLDRLGVYDITRMTDQQWLDFLETVLIEFKISVQNLVDDIPF